MSLTRWSSRTIMLVVLLVLVNTPLLVSTWNQVRLSTSGKEVQATVTRAQVLPPAGDPGYWVTFRFDQDIDPKLQEWPADIDRATFEKARRTEQIRVRVLPGHPATYRTAGQVRNWLGLVLTVLADVGLVGLILLSRRRSSGRRPEPMRVAAVEAVTTGPPDPLIEQVEGDLHLIRGRVLYADADELILDAGEREVIVVLDGHECSVAEEDAAQVRGRRFG